MLSQDEKEWAKKIGVRFTSTNFGMDGEIKAVRPNVNEIDVILIPSDGHAWQETWNLEHTKYGFERGEYIEKPKPEGRVVVW